MEKRLFTSESVTEGHPDKMCDAISDAILDALMEKDPMSRVACETCATTGLVMVMGEITTNAYAGTVCQLLFLYPAHKKSPLTFISGLDKATPSNPLIARFLAQAGTFLPSRTAINRGCRDFTGPMYLHHSE